MKNVKTCVFLHVKGRKTLQSQRRHNECETFSKNEIAVGSFEVLFSLHNSISGRLNRNSAVLVWQVGRSAAHFHDVE